MCCFFSGVTLPFSPNDLPQVDGLELLAGEDDPREVLIESSLSILMRLVTLSPLPEATEAAKTSALDYTLCISVLKKIIALPILVRLRDARNTRPPCLYESYSK
jgi:hypothetical protein